MSETVIINKSFYEDLINEQSAKIMMLEYNYYALRVEQYEFFIIQKPEEDEIVKSLRQQIGKLHLIKVALKNKFIEKFGLKLWDDLRLEYVNNII